MDKLAKLTNLAVLCAALLFAAVLVRDYLPQNKSSQDLIPVNALVGTQLDLSGVKWQADRSVVLVLSTSCGFCTASAPFYRQLTAVTKATGVRSLAVFPQTVREVEEYLASAGIAIDTILSVEPNSLGVSGTPTLFLVNKSGRIEKVWVGQLDKNEEQEVLRTLS